jgi:PAS domain S-box-containing protein
MNQLPGNITDVFERITDAFVALDNNWCFTYMNKRAGEIFNHDPQAMVGKHIWTEFPEGINQPFYKAYHRAMWEQQYIHVEEYYPPYDKWFENHIYPSPGGLSIFFRDVTEKKKIELELQRQRIFIESIINASPDIIYIYDIEEQKNVFVNDGIQTNLGYSNEEIKEMGNQVLPILMPKEDFEIYLNDYYPRYATLKDKEILAHEFRMRHKNGNLHWLYTKESIFLRTPDGTPKQIFGITSDITEQKKADLILAGEKKLLEMIVTEKPLEEILNIIALNFESYSDNAFASILLLDDEGTHLRHGSGPNLPDAFNKGIDGEAIGPVAGSCGTAAYRKERVIVSDIATDPLWVNYRYFALSFGLKACWSTPIINYEGNVYGTFAIYYKECRTPDEADLILIERSANQVKIVLERYYKDTRIKDSEEKFKTLVQQATDAIFIADSAGRFITVNTSACMLSQYSEAELLKMSIYDFAVMEDIQKNPFHFDELKQGKTVITERLMKGKNGIPVQVEINAKLLTDGRLLTFVRDITERKKAEEKLQKSEELFSGAFHASPAGVIITRIADGKIIDANESFLKMFEFTREEAIGHTSIELNMLSPGERTRLIQQQIASGGLINFELLSQSKSGKPINLLFSSKQLKVNDEACHITTLIDITERKKAQEKILESEKLYRNLFQNMRQGFAYCKGIIKEGKVVDYIYITVNTEFEKILKVENINEKKLSEVFPDAMKSDPSYYQILQEVVLLGKTIKFETNYKPLGIWLSVTFYKAENENFVLLIEDISERKKAEEEIKSSNEKLHQLTAHLQSIREEERKRISREIHDELGQQLTAVKMDVAWIDKKIPEESSALKSKLKNTIHLLDSSNLSIRKILNELRTGVMEHQTLEDTMKWQGQQFTERTGIPVIFTTTETAIKLPEQISTCIFRVYQESLTNIIRYAKAKKILTSLTIIDGNIIFTVEDDGKGFDMAAVQYKKTFGILGMKERVLSLKGQFDLFSAKGKGTKISVSLPFKT